MDIQFFIHLCVGGHLGYFKFLAIVTNAACYKHSCTSFVWKCIFLSLGYIYLGMELLGHMLTLWLTFWRTAKLFSKAALPFYILTGRCESVSSHLYWWSPQYFYSSHSSRCEEFGFYPWMILSQLTSISCPPTRGQAHNPRHAPGCCGSGLSVDPWTRFDSQSG